MTPLRTAIVIFEGVEVLDFAGPFEVFSRARLEPGVESRRTDEGAPFQVFTVAPRRGELRATGGLRVVPDHVIDDHPPIDLLVVPGGFGTRPLLSDETVIDWIRRTARSSQHVASVCTGSLLLAKAGLLQGRRATTHWCALNSLAEMGAGVEVVPDVRYVDDGVITSAGVAAGIDMAFHLVETLCGKAVADETAQYIDYPRR